MQEISRRTRLLRNLKDLGFQEKEIAQYLELEKRGQRWEQYRLLNRQRALLLEELHCSQARIDSLDYLLHAMEKEKA